MSCMHPAERPVGQERVPAQSMQCDPVQRTSPTHESLPSQPMSQSAAEQLTPLRHEGDPAQTMPHRSAAEQVTLPPQARVPQ